ncbi:MAG: hypothetical protein DYG90_03565 [Chloroflexi bacterium CFX6]|nr:hypothetical protein [Chloroflexi bacterium CFX6]
MIGAYADYIRSFIRIADDRIDQHVARELGAGRLPNGAHIVPRTTWREALERTRYDMAQTIEARREGADAMDAAIGVQPASEMIIEDRDTG